jgi:D-3-phosphoglycerate dehydrogenase
LTVAAPAIWINSSADRRLGIDTAVARAGGVVVSSSGDADAVIWDAYEPEALREHIHFRTRWVHLSSAGVEDWFDVGVIDSRRTWTASKGAAAEPIAEYILAMLLCATRRLPETIRARRWVRLEPEALRDAVVGIIGAGNIGEATIRVLAPFGVTTIALTRRGRTVAGASRSLGPEGLDELLSASDYLVLALPLTPTTHHLLNRKRLRHVKKGAFLVNVGRGAVVDTAALVEALESGDLSGVALDVTDPEPLPFEHPLWGHVRSLITSHTASTPALAWPWFVERVEENVRRFASGRPLLGEIDVQERY